MVENQIQEATFIISDPLPALKIKCSEAIREISYRRRRFPNRGECLQETGSIDRQRLFPKVDREKQVRIASGYLQLSRRQTGSSPGTSQCEAQREFRRLVVGEIYG